MTDPVLQRPRQVTVAAGIGLVGCLVLVIDLFDTMAHTRTVDARDGIASFLSKPPGDGLGLSVDQVLELWRVVLLLSGALAAAAFVMGIFLIQRHNGARIGFTVAAGLLLLAMPAVGVVPVVLAVAATGLWSEAARDWFAGRAPRPKPAPETTPSRFTVEPPKGWGSAALAVPLRDGPTAARDPPGRARRLPAPRGRLLAAAAAAVASAEPPTRRAHGGGAAPAARLGAVGGDPDLGRCRAHRRDPGPRDGRARDVPG